MKKAPVHPREKARLEALKRLQVLDTPPDPELDHLTELAAKLCGTSISLISLVAEDRQWFKSKLGLDAAETPRDISFCGHAILGDSTFEVQDAATHPDFHDNPFVTGDLNLRFYAGAPLTTKDGLQIGTLCVISNQPRSLTPEQRDTLESLAKQVVTLLEYKILEAERKTLLENLEYAQKTSRTGSWQWRIADQHFECSGELHRIIETAASRSDPSTLTWEEFLALQHPEDLPQFVQSVERARSGEADIRIRHRLVFSEGRRVKIVETRLAAPAKDLTGAVLLSGTCREVTDEIDAELQAGEILKAISDGILIHNQAGKVQAFNPQALAMLGLSEASLKGQAARPQDWDLIDEEGRPADGNDFPALRTLRSGQSSLKKPLTLHRPDGRVRHLEVTSLPVTRPGEFCPRTVVSSITDVSKVLETSAELERVLDALPSTIIRADPQGHCWAVNSSWSTLTGRNRSAALAQGWLGSIHPGDRQRVLDAWTSLGKNGTPMDLGFRIKHASGRIVFVQAVGTRTIDLHSQSTGLVLSLRDITRLKESENQTQFFQNSLNEAAFVAFLDRNGRIEYANPRFARSSGREAEELSGKRHSLLLHPNSRRKTLLPIYKTLVTGLPWSGTLAVGTEGSEPTWLSASISPLKDAAGRVLRYSLIGTDISGEMSALRALESKTHESNQFFSLSLDLLCVADMQGHFTRVNPAFTDILGYSEDELTSQSFLSFIHPDDIPATLAEMANLEKGVRTLRFENRYRCKSGEYRTLSWVAHPDPRTGMIFAAARDITEEKRKVELQLIAERNESARRVAEIATQAKSEFLAAMSHEIRTPLNGVLAMSELLAETDLNTDQKEIIQTISSSGRTLLTLINDILDFSKIEAGKMALERQEFDLGKFILEVARPHELTARRRGLRFETSIPEEGDLVIGDSGRIGQIVNNLLSNALKFTSSGCISISLESKTSNGNSHSTIIVKDSGTGIPKEAQSRLFQAFTQADQSISRKYGGTGLGLTICKKLTDLMGGTIGFESSEGEGTTFWVELPLEISACSVGAEVDKGMHSTDAPANAIPFQDSTARILVAEDNPTNQLVIGRTLKKLGISRVDFAADGQEALQMVQDKQYDLVLMDCQMPEMDGYQASRQIRSLPGVAATIPIVALTANALHEEEAKCLAVGMNGFLTKPLDRPKLVACLQKILTASPKAA